MRKFLVLFLLLPAVGMAQIDTNPEYIVRRATVLSMLDSSMAIVLKAVNSAPLANEYIQEHNFYYLTGINSPANILLMSPKGISVGNKTRHTIIFYADIESVKNIELGVGDTLMKISEFKPVFSKLLPSVSNLYYSAPDLIVVNDWLSDKAHFMDREMKNGFKARYPNLKLLPAEALVGRLRTIKSPQETGFIRKASDITADGMIAAMKLATPGVFEYELQAAIEYEYTRQGAMLRGFPSIIGSGLNNLILHYSYNTRQTQAGDLVVMDVGAKYQGYSTDITRTIPVSGRYSDAQKEIYSMVLEVQKEAIAMLKPGLQMDEVERFARNAFKKFGYGNYYIHGLMHPVGLDVHDISTSKVLQPGMVITVEPGLYFPEGDTAVPEKYRGFGIRIEDTILITADGCEILTKKVPKEIDEIEKIMRKKSQLKKHRFSI